MKPKNTRALHYNLGRIAEETGNETEARRQYERSLEARPNNASVRERLERL